MSEVSNDNIQPRETRKISLPDGSSTSTTQSIDIWEIYELIKETNFFTHDDIIALTKDNMIAQAIASIRPLAALSPIFIKNSSRWRFRA